MHLAERAAVDRKVLRDREYLPPVDHAAAGHHAVAKGAAPVEAEVGGAHCHIRLLLDEGVLVEQQVEALAGGQLALGMLGIDTRLPARPQHLLPCLAAPLERFTHRATPPGVGARARTPTYKSIFRKEVHVTCEGQSGPIVTTHAGRCQMIGRASVLGANAKSGSKSLTLGQKKALPTP